MLEIILFFLGVALWLWGTSIVMMLTLLICVLSLVIGAIGGCFIGVIKGAINYFGAIREELRFDKY